MAKIQVNTNNKAIMLNNKALLAQEFIGIPRELVNGTMQQIQDSHTYTLPDSALHLGSYALYAAFYSDTQLRGIDFNNLTDITGVYCLYGICQGATGLTSVDFSNVTNIDATFAMYNAFYGCTALTDVDFSSLTSISGSGAMQSAFRNTGLINIDLSSVTSIGGTNAMNMTFRDCTALTELNFPSLVTISGVTVFSGLCNGCTSLVTVTLPNVETITGSNAMVNAFQGCTALTNISFPKLKTIGEDVAFGNYGQFTSFLQDSSNVTTLTFPELEAIYVNGTTNGAHGTFANNNYLEKLYFPKLTTITYGTGANTTNRNACKNIFYGCSALTELHFGAANQAAIEATDGYSTAWGRGAGNVTIYFDL